MTTDHDGTPSTEEHSNRYGLGAGVVVPLMIGGLNLFRSRYPHDQMTRVGARKWNREQVQFDVNGDRIEVDRPVIHRDADDPTDE